MTFDEVLSLFQVERRFRDGAQCICPSHQDKKASMSDKRDCDYVGKNSVLPRNAPARDEAKEIILNILEDGERHQVSELDTVVKASGVSFITLKRAKSELKREGKINYTSEGFGNKKYSMLKKLVRSVDKVIH